MIVTNLGVVLGVYLVRRAYQQLQRYRRRKRLPARLDPPPQQLDAQNSAQAIAEYQHHFKVSSVALFSTSVGYALYPPLGIVNLGLITYTALPVLDRAQAAFQRDKSLKNDSLSLVVTGLCVVTGNYFAASVQNWVYHLGSRLVEENKANTASELSQAFIQQPEQVWRVRDGMEMQIPLSELSVNDVVVIKMGEFLPVDGVIKQGRALIDQQALTGESSPVERFVGDTVMAGTLIIGGTIHVQANHSGADSQAQQLNHLLEHTRDYKTELQLKGEAWSDTMAQPLLVVSGGTAVFFGLSPATSLLFSAPTNSIRALLSLQTITHVKWATEHGLLIKDGRVLEELPWIDTILFDKTGTLTYTEPEVTRVLACGTLDEVEVLRVAAAAEQHLQHPIANAIINRATELGLDLPEVDDSYYEIGFGLSVNIHGQAVHVGSQRFIEEVLKDDYLPSELERVLHSATGNTFIFVAVDKQLQGLIELYPRVREEVPQVLEQLRKRGLTNIAVVSGDQLAPTERLAYSLGIQKVFAEVLPQDKAALIRSLQQQGHRVCFIGDGINDALAMKQANVSICLSSATEITRSTAQLVLMNDELIHLRDAFDMAVHLQMRLGGNLLFWTGFGLGNAALVPLLSFTPLQSSVLYAGAFAWGFRQATKPGWLADAKRNALPEDDSDAILGEVVVEKNERSEFHNMSNLVVAPA